MTTPENATTPETGGASSTDYSALFAEAQQERMTEQTAPLLGEITVPESRRYTSGEEFRFLIHTTLDNPERTLDWLSSGEGDGFRIDADKPLNTSLIDQSHTTTFEGASGFIIRPSTDREDITGVWAADVGADTQTKGQPKITGDEALAGTMPGEYNQIHLRAGKVEGVFIRIAADTGQELGYSQSNAALRRLAGERDLPVAEIAVEPRAMTESEPVLSEPVSTGNGSGELYHIVIPRNGYEFRIDVVKQAEKGDISFVGPEGFAMRMAKVDGYDVWDRNLTPDDIKTVSTSLTALRERGGDIVQYAEQEISKNYS